jgi:hypothetical protein
MIHMIPRTLFRYPTKQQASNRPEKVVRRWVGPGDERCPLACLDCVRRQAICILFIFFLQHLLWPNL